MDIVLNPVFSLLMLNLEYFLLLLQITYNILGAAG